MAGLLIRLFTKNAKNESERRLKVGEACGITGIILNILLVIGKMTVGIMTASLAIVADAMNNLSDAGSSITTLVGFRLSGQKPDKEHPYGHGRMEYIAALTVAFIILVMGALLGREAIGKIIHPQENTYTKISLMALGAAILVKAYMAFFNFREAKNIDSKALRAVGKDSLVDCIATGVIIVCASIQAHTGLALDGVAGLLIAGFIMLQGIGAVHDAINPLLGMEPDGKLVQAIKDTTLNFDENIVGIHDLMIHDYGPGRRIISLHAEIPSDGDLLQLHDIIDNLEKKLANDLNCMATIHMDPVAVHDPLTLSLKQKVQETIKAYKADWDFHDFRVVHGDTHTNLLFDLVVPFDADMSEQEIRSKTEQLIHEKIGEEYFAVFEIDRE